MKFPWSYWFRPAVLVVAALVALSVGSLFFSTMQERDFYLFEVDVATDTSGHIQLFYDLGRGYNQVDSSVQPLPANARALRYGFVIPRGTVIGLRLDPLDTKGKLSIGRPAIVDFRRKEITHFDIQDFTPLTQVELSPIDKNSIAVTSTGTDPALLLRLPAPLRLGHTAVEFALLVLVPLCLKVFLACWFAAGSLQMFGLSFLLRLKKQALHRPVLTLFAIGLFAVVIQCHPIIFFGRSFVSPDNGTFLLYDHTPTLPGYTSKGAEDTQGSDVAALLNSSLGYPGLERDALFRFGELPLWNRYSLGGLPLLGQGQSMFGSILNFIIIFADGSPGSWDLRYVISRWLYAVGLGLAAWLLTRHLGAASIVCLVGPFIGFFGFRMNHMAQLSLDASPWILVGWTLLRDRPSARAALLLFIANWEVMNSGTVKEAYMLILCLNLAGALVVLWSPFSAREKVIRLCVAAIAGLCLILISAPVWLVLLDALSSGATHYDRASVQQAPPWQILGFFDEMFFRRFHPTEAHVLPAVNFVFFSGLIWTLVRAREVWKERSSIALSVTLLLSTSLAYGIIPGAWLMQVPFINGIYHVHNTFSCSMVVLVSVLAGFGFKAVWESANTTGWWKGYIEFVGIVLAFFLVYHGTAESPPGSPFYWSLWGSLCFALVAGHLAIRAGRRQPHLGLLVVGIGASLVLTVWHHSQYITNPFEHYIVKPGVRVGFHNHSDAVEQVDQALAKEPFRAVGLSYNDFAGFSEILRWESIYGVDPVRNGGFDALCDTADMTKKDWGDAVHWHEEDLPFILPIQNLLNVRYYVSTHTSPPAVKKGLRWIGSYDLDIYESPGVWPRAFFTNQLITYALPAELVALVRKNAEERPFAALNNKDLSTDLSAFQVNDLTSRVVSPASGYRMTANTTGFTVNASSGGLAVLAENYLARDFRAFINGKQVDYFKVNEACKGVVIPAAGTYEIRFEYWPRHLTLGLVLMAVGLGLSGLLLSVRLYNKRVRRDPHRVQGMFHAV